MIRLFFIFAAFLFLLLLPFKGAEQRIVDEKPLVGVTSPFPSAVSEVITDRLGNEKGKQTVTVVSPGVIH